MNSEGQMVICKENSGQGFYDHNEWRIIGGQLTGKSELEVVNNSK